MILFLVLSLIVVVWTLCAVRTTYQLWSKMDDFNREIVEKVDFFNAMGQIPRSWQITVIVLVAIFSPALELSLLPTYLYRLATRKD